MHAMKQVSISALICGATMLVIGSASALPLAAGQAAIGASAENAAKGLVIQTACGPGGCGQGGTRVPQGTQRQGGGWGGGGTTGWGGGLTNFGIGTGMQILQQLENEQTIEDPAAAKRCRGNVCYFPSSPRLGIDQDSLILQCSQLGGSSLVRTKSGYTCQGFTGTRVRVLKRW